MSQRTVDDIIHEVEELKKTGKDSGSEKQPAVRFRADTGETILQGKGTAFVMYSTVNSFAVLSLYVLVQ